MASWWQRLLGVEPAVKDWDPPLEGWQPPVEWAYGQSSAGPVITAESAMRLSAVWACVRVLSETIASLPLHVYRDLPNGDREKAKDTPEYAILHDRPNSRMTSFIWREVGEGHVETWGNHYAEIVRDGQKRLQELHLLRVDRMEVKWESGARRYHYRNPDGSETVLQERDVFHVPGMGFDGLVGYSVLRNHRDTLGLAQAAQEYGSSFLRNNARPAMVLKHPKTLDEGIINRLGVQMDKLRGSKGAGKTVVLEEGLDFSPIGIAPEDAQYIETRKFQTAEIARLFGVPPHMIGDVERSTSWGAGIEEQTLGFVKFVIGSRLKRWEQEINSKLLAGTDLTAEFSVEGLLRADIKTRYSAYQIGRNGGWLNPNEIRRFENLPRREDEGGDEYLLPLNVASVGDEEEVAPGAPPALRVIKTLSVVDPRSRNGKNHAVSIDH
jgi:HK97 family phage portal protein